MKIAHIVNPVIVNPSSDLFVAQPITFSTLQTARDFAAGKVEVELYTAQYPEDRPLVPPGFIPTPDLTRSVLDFGNFSVPRRLPLIRDILDRLYDAAETTQADYLVYTNVDIAVQPHFYLAISALIEKGYDAFTINRRTITGSYTEVAQISMMAAEVGQPHKGHDCFVFPRQAYPNYYITNVCLGAFRVGMAVLVNMLYQARRFELFKDLHLTYHLGNERIHRLSKYQDYKRYNEKEFIKILAYYDVLEHPREHKVIQQLHRSFSPKKKFSRLVSTLNWYLEKFKRLKTAWKQD